MHAQRGETAHKLSPSLLSLTSHHHLTYHLLKIALPKLVAEHAKPSILTSHFLKKPSTLGFSSMVTTQVFPTSALRHLISSREGNAAISYIIHSEHCISNYRLMWCKVSCGWVELRKEKRCRYHPERHHSKASDFVIQSFAEQVRISKWIFEEGYAYYLPGHPEPSHYRYTAGQGRFTGAADFLCFLKAFCNPPRKSWDSDPSRHCESQSTPCYG